MPSELTEAYSGADLIANPPPNTIAYNKITQFVNARFSIVTPIVGSTPLLYTRSTSTSIVETPGNTSYADCTIGVPTQADDFPGIAVNYTQTSVSGTGYDSTSGTIVAYDLGRSTVTFRFEPNPNTVRAVVHLIGTPAAGADVDFGTFATAAVISSTDSGIGLQPSDVRLIDASLAGSGAMYGPQASEFGFVLEYTRFQGGAANPVQRIQAVIVGRR